MTVDELVELTEALIEEVGLSLPSIRHGDVGIGGSLTDDQFLLALRFLAGDRPAVAALPPRQRTVPAMSPEEIAHRQAALDEIEHEDDGDTPPRPFDSEFSGVTLP